MGARLRAKSKKTALAARAATHADRGVSFGFTLATARTWHRGDSRIKSGYDDIASTLPLTLAPVG
jgi:hypothetical protein